MSSTTALGFTPAFSIYKGSEDITAKFSDRLISLHIDSREGGGDADTCTIVLDDCGYAIALPSIGEDSVTLSVAMGYAESILYAMGTFQVDAVTLVFPPKGLTLRGNSVAMNSDIKAPIIASFEGKSLGEIVGSIAESAGATPSIDPALSGLPIPFLNQSQSLGHLLTVLEDRFNALAKFSDGYLSFTKRGTGLNASGQTIGTVELSPEDLASYEINLSNRNSYSHVKAQWFDRVTNTTMFATSTVPGSPNSTVPFTLRKPYASQVEAQAAADSQMSALNRKQKTGNITLAKGLPSIRGGQSITVTGTRDGVDGTYQVGRAIHSLTKSVGLMTTLEVYDDGGNDGGDLGGGEGDAIDLSGVPAIPIPPTPGGLLGHI